MAVAAYQVDILVARCLIGTYSHRGADAFMCNGTRIVLRINPTPERNFSTTVQIDEKPPLPAIFLLKLIRNKSFLGNIASTLLIHSLSSTSNFAFNYDGSSSVHSYP